MAEYINREELKEMLRREWTKHVPMELDPSLAYVLANIDELPSIDIVHCPECKWAGRDDHCPAIEVYMICGDNGYCSCGERRE